jgi:hypothetical protein
MEPITILPTGSAPVTNSRLVVKPGKKPQTRGDKQYVRILSETVPVFKNNLWLSDRSRPPAHTKTFEPIRWTNQDAHKVSPAGSGILLSPEQECV